MTTEGDDTSDEPKARARVLRQLGQRVKKLDQSPALMTAAKLVRELLPGDSSFGDPLSTAGRVQPQLVGRRLARLTAERPGVMREAGLTALQVWEAVSEAQGRGRGKRELAIVFTDLVDFSQWALEAGDDPAVELLRDVDAAIEPVVRQHGGEVVKRLGDGMMAVFDAPGAALAAVLEACRELNRIEVAGYVPQLRGGIHVGHPRKIGGDYLGIDVNVAARLTEQAGANEILVSDRTLELLDTDGIDARRKRRFKVKGVPKDLTAYVVST
jgi:adenylate cyclase